MQTGIIPVNSVGKENDLSFSRTAESNEKAIDCFKRAYKRLLNPPIWHELAGTLTAEFRLVNSSGKEAERLASVGDLFMIDLPGPGTKAGSGYDWVKVVSIVDETNENAEDEMFAMKLQPAPNPATASNETAHFFQAGASSTFIVTRKGLTVSASYHGRNEVPNTGTESAMDNIRNTIVATGAAIGLSEAQWSALCKGFLEDEIGG
jgi:hypothetical protein